MSDQPQTAIEIGSVVKRFGDFTALENVSLSIRDNEFFTLLGPSGCGKTTLLRSIAGFENVTEGEIKLFGDDIADLPPNRRPINTVFQNYALFPHMTILENVMFGIEMRGEDKAAAKARAEEMLELVQLSQFSHRKPSQLSGGQQQRVALARALAPRPRVLLLDEPLSALDLKLRKAMQLELKALQRETGITFIFVTHDQEEALTMSDRIAVMSNGKVQQLGGPRDIYEAPDNVFVADFIGETNLLEVSVDKIINGRAHCHLGGGHEITCNEVAGIGIGSKVHISVRPERLFLSAQPFEEESMAGRVIENVYVGTDVQSIVQLNDGPKMTIRTQNSELGNKAVFDIGADVFVSMEAGAARLLHD